MNSKIFFKNNCVDLIKSLFLTVLRKFQNRTKPFTSVEGQTKFEIKKKKHIEGKSQLCSVHLYLLAIDNLLLYVHVSILTIK